MCRIFWSMNKNLYGFLRFRNRCCFFCGVLQSTKNKVVGGFLRKGCWKCTANNWCPKRCFWTDVVWCTGHHKSPQLLANLRDTTPVGRQLLRWHQTTEEIESTSTPRHGPGQKGVFFTSCQYLESLAVPNCWKKSPNISDRYPKKKESSPI